MLNKLNKIFINNITILPKIIAISTFFTDILTLYYINNYWLKFKLTEIVRLSFAARGQVQISESSLEQASAVLSNSIGTMFFFFLILHLIIYILLFMNKKWAINYVSRYALTTVILSTLEIILTLNDFSAWMILLMTITILYFISYLGLKIIKKNLAR